MTASRLEWLTEPILELPPEVRSAWDFRSVDVGAGQAVQNERVQKLASILGAPPCNAERVALVIDLLGEIIPGLRILTGDEALHAQNALANDRPAGRPRTWGYLQSRSLVDAVDGLKAEQRLATDAEALRVLAESWSKEAGRVGGQSAPKLRSLQTLLSRARKLHAEPSSTK